MWAPHSAPSIQLAQVLRFHDLAGPSGMAHVSKIRSHPTNRSCNCFVVHKMRSASSLFLLVEIDFIQSVANAAILGCSMLGYGLESGHSLE